MSETCTPLWPTSRRATHHRPRLTVALLGISVVFGACSSGGTSSHSESNVLSDLAEQAKSSGYDDQAAILESSDVTYDQLVGAMVTARQCVKDLGYPVTSIERDYAGRLSYTFDLASATDQDSALEAADACQAAHAELIQLAYDRLHPPTATLGVDTITSCLERRGTTLPDGTTTMRAVQALLGRPPDPSNPLDSCYAEVVGQRTVVVE